MESMHFTSRALASPAIAVARQGKKTGGSTACLRTGPSGIPGRFRASTLIRLLCI